MGNEEILCTGKFLKLMRCHEKGVSWECVDLGGARKSAVVVAITQDGELILEKHYRYPLRSHVIELPAGLVDGNESPEDCARRELEEETGYSPRELFFLFSGVICHSLTHLEAYYFYAPGVKRVGEQNLEPSEEIEVILVPWEHAEDFLLNLPEGVYLGANVLAALYMARRYEKVLKQGSMRDYE